MHQQHKKKKSKRLCKIKGFASYKKFIFYNFFFYYLFHSDRNVEFSYDESDAYTKKTRPWELKAPSQYCMTGGIAR